MHNISKNQRGFGGAGQLAIILVVAIIGAIGLFVMSKGNSSSGEAATTTRDSKQSMPTYAASDNYVNVIQKDQTIKQLTPAEAATKADQARILQSLHETCAGKPEDNVTVKAVTFQKQEDFRLQGGFAYINATACDPAYGVHDTPGSGRSIYLHKDTTSGIWVVDEMTQTGASCAKVEGKGYPFEIVQSCVNSDGSLKALQ